MRIKLEYTQEMLVLNLYQLFEVVPQFQGNQTRTLNDILDEYIEPLYKTTKEWLKVFIAIANNPNQKDTLTINIQDDEIEQYYNEELFQLAIAPLLDMSIETIKLDGYSSLEYYRKTLALKNNQ